MSSQTHTRTHTRTDTRTHARTQEKKHARKHARKHFIVPFFKLASRPRVQAESQFLTGSPDSQLEHHPKSRSTLRRPGGADDPRTVKAPVPLRARLAVLLPAHSESRSSALPPPDLNLCSVCPRRRAGRRRSSCCPRCCCCRACTAPRRSGSAKPGKGEPQRARSRRYRFASRFRWPLGSAPYMRAMSAGVMRSPLLLLPALRRARVRCQRGNSSDDTSKVPAL